MIDGIEEEVIEYVIENTIARSDADKEEWTDSNGVAHMAYTVPSLQELCIRKMAQSMAHDPEEVAFRALRKIVFASEAQEVRDSLNKKLGV